MGQINNYDYMLINKSTDITSDNYKIQYFKDKDAPTVFGQFKKLSWDKVETYKFGHVWYNNESKPIDLITSNKDTLNKYAKIFNEQTGPINPDLKPVQILISYDNIYNVIGSLQKETELANSLHTKYSEIYDSTYSKYIYRAARNNSKKIVLQKDKYILENKDKIPVFSFDSRDSIDHIDFAVVIRNIPVKMKIIKTSSHNEINSYLAIYPEYIIGKYKEYIDSIMYIQKIKGSIENNTIYYSNLSDNDPDLLFPYSNAGNIQDASSNKVLDNLQSFKKF